MANITFNISKSRIAELVNRVVNNDPTNAGLVVRLYKTIESDALLRDRANLAAIQSGSNVECDFDGYIHKIITDSTLTAPTIDNSADTVTVSIPAQSWPSAGGLTPNTIVKGIIFYCSDVTVLTTSNQIPLTAHDVSVTTNGNNLNLNAGVFNTAS